MRVYKLTGKAAAVAQVVTEDTAETESPKSLVKWVGSQAECSNTRAQWMSGGKVKRRDDIETEEVEVPTSKKELLEWLNSNAV